MSDCKEEMIELPRGTTYEFTGTFRKDGDPISLVGATIYFTIKPVKYDGTADDSTATYKDDITNGNADGTYVIPITPVDLATVLPGIYYMSAIVKLSDATQRYPLFDKKIKITADSTNRGI